MKNNRWQKFFARYYLIIIASISIIVVSSILLTKTLFTQPTYVYVTVKLGQGLWWASTAKAPFWYTTALKKGDKTFGFGGKVTTEIQRIKYYNAFTSNQYDMYITAKLLVNGNNKSGYSFDRSLIAIGAPIELNFKRSNITGTIIDITTKKNPEKYVDKIVYLVNQAGYNRSFPYLYDNIKIGDTYFDGNQVVFEVLDKSLEPSILTIPNYIRTDLNIGDITSIQNIIVKAKIRAKEKNGRLFFGEENIVAINAPLTLVTPNYFYENFVIRKIE
jgi:hypothetical protein